ncbi:MAG TPA: hypothetical protein VET27_02700 [Mycobacterium sp.]|nr:hypothetical protein [Mycobacterium sp.]
MNTFARRIAAAVALAVAPAVLATGFATTSQASSVVPNPGPQTFAVQQHHDGVNGTQIKPGTAEPHRHQQNR